MGLCAPGRHSNFGVYPGQRRNWNEQDLSRSRKDNAASSGGQAGATRDKIGSPGDAYERSWPRTAGERRAPAILLGPKLRERDVGIEKRVTREPVIPGGSQYVHRDDAKGG